MLKSVKKLDDACLESVVGGSHCFGCDCFRLVTSLQLINQQIQIIDLKNELADARGEPRCRLSGGEVALISLGITVGLVALTTAGVAIVHRIVEG